MTGRSAGPKLVFAVSMALPWLAAESYIAWSGLDMRLLEPLLYAQGADVAVHRASDDVDLHYELTPGARSRFLVGGPRLVTINALGFRDVERRARKPKGVFRIVCLGGSNTYGALVNDRETYPASLERALNKNGSGRFEVWNAGVSAYTLSQNVAAARAIVARYDPDLLIFQFSNPGRRAFFLGAPIRRYFDADPRQYVEALPFPRDPGAPHVWLMRRWRLYRCVVIAINRRWPDPRWKTVTPQSDAHNALSWRDFQRDYGERVPLVLFDPVGGQQLPRSSPGVKVLDLSARRPASAGTEFTRMHPPAHVYAWYAKELAAFLRRERLLEARGAAR